MPFARSHDDRQIHGLPLPRGKNLIRKRQRLCGTDPIVLVADLHEDVFLRKLESMALQPIKVGSNTPALELSQTAEVCHRCEQYDSRHPLIAGGQAQRSIRTARNANYHHVSASGLLPRQDICDRARRIVNHWSKNIRPAGIDALTPTVKPLNLTRFHIGTVAGDINCGNVIAASVQS